MAAQEAVVEAAPFDAVAGAATDFLMSSATVFGKRTLDMRTCEVNEENNPAITHGE